MKRVWIFLFLALYLFLSACQSNIQQESTPLSLTFHYLTGDWKDLEELSSEERKDDPTFMKKYWKQQASEQSPEKMNQQLAGTKYRFRFGSELWELYHEEKLVATGKSLDYFLTDKKHLIACTWSSAPFPQCFIDNQWKTVDTLQAFPKIFDDQVYAIVFSGERDHQLLKGEQVVYSFEAFFPTDLSLLGLEVDQSGWWLLYRTISSKDDILHYLVHNGENLNQKHGRSEAFELRKIKDQLFYFYQKEGKIWYHFGEQDYETPFEEILYDHCCWYAGYDIEFWDDFFSFYAKKDGKFGYYRAEISS